MSNFSLNDVQKKYVIELLASPNGMDYGWVRDMFKRAFGFDMTGETVGRIALKFSKKIEEVRKIQAESYKDHKLWNRKFILDKLLSLSEMGEQEEIYGEYTATIKDESTGEETKERRPLVRRDLKISLGALKLAVEMIHEIEARESTPAQGSHLQDALAKLSLVKTNSA
jgi:hypothetical protein